jgi:hypothetical protein
MATLSEKVSKTVEVLGLTARPWVMPDIRWVREMRTVRGEVTCPECACEGHPHALAIRALTDPEYQP